MGMYTELALGVRLKGNVPAEVVDVLAQMTSEQNPSTDIQHPLFQTERWGWMLRSGGSYYFDAQPCLVWKYDDISEAWYLTVWTNIKNYSGEWDHFIDFISPYVDASDGEHLGHLRYEEDDDPTLIYFRNGMLELR